MGLLFLFDSDSEAISWIFTVLNSLQVSHVYSLNMHVSSFFKSLIA